MKIAAVREVERPQKLDPCELGELSRADVIVDFHCPEVLTTLSHALVPARGRCLLA